MQTTFGHQQPQLGAPANAAAPAAPAMPAAVASQPDSVMFGHNTTPKFGANFSPELGDGRGNIFVRFATWVRNALHMGQDKLEEATPEITLNAEHNALVTKVNAVKDQLSRIVGESKVLEQELGQQVLREAKERSESEAAFAALEKAQEKYADDPVKLDAFKAKALKELDEADKELTKVRTMEEQVKTAQTAAKRAQSQIAEYNVQLKAAIERIEQGKADAAEIKGLQKLKEMQDMLKEASGEAVGLTNSTGTVLHNLAVKKEALKAQLNDGRTDAEIDAEIEVEAETKAMQQEDRLASILAARKAAKEGGEAPKA